MHDSCVKKRELVSPTHVCL